MEYTSLCLDTEIVKKLIGRRVGSEILLLILNLSERFDGVLIGKIVILFIFEKMKIVKKRVCLLIRQRIEFRNDLLLHCFIHT